VNSDGEFVIKPLGVKKIGLSRPMSRKKFQVVEKVLNVKSRLEFRFWNFAEIGEKTVPCFSA
jgi:hypothetical protein